MGNEIKAAVQSVVQDLFDRNGSVKTVDLVAAARPKDSPAHPAFEWDNKKAGDEYRLIQARHWIRAVTVTRPDSTEAERLIHVPRIVTDSDTSKEGEYKPLSVIITLPDEFARALEYASSKMAAAKRALDDLYKAAEATGRSDQAAMIAQMSRATELWASALTGLH
jgi:hypothetical protein